MQNKIDPALYWIGLNSIPGVGRVTFRKLVAAFGSPKQALEAPLEELAKIDGLSRKALDAVTSFPWREQAERELAKASGAGVAVTTMDSPGYPDCLRHTPDPPLYLYV